MEFTVGAMEKLVELLRPPEPEVLQGSDLQPSEFEITSNREKETAEIVKSPKTIEEFEEQEAKEAEQLCCVGSGIGDRKVPEYTMNYQQAVSAEDVFLQVLHLLTKSDFYTEQPPSSHVSILTKIGPKTPSSASCENMIVRIKMPGDKMANVDLSVDTSSVTVNSSQYHLSLPLPHGINPDASKASWDTDSETLILTLRLDREFDFVNF